MAILTFESFEDWSTSLTGTALLVEPYSRGYAAVLASNASNAVFSGGRYGFGKYVSVYGDTSYYDLYNGALLVNGSCGVAMKNVSSAATCRLNLFDSAAIACAVTLLTTNQISIAFNPSGTANDITATVSLPAGKSNRNWCYVEARWSATVFEVAVDGVVVYTKVFTAFTGFQSVRINQANGSTNIGYFDDFYLTDASSFLGEVVSVQLSNTATVTNTGTVTGAADAHTALNSRDGDTSYVAFSDVDQKVLCEVSDLSYTPSSIKAVRLVRDARRTGTVTPQERLIIKTATENFPESAVSALQPEYAVRALIVETDPADATAWNKTKVDGMQVGIKRGA